MNEQNKNTVAHIKSICNESSTKKKNRDRQFRHMWIVFFSSVRTFYFKFLHIEFYRFRTIACVAYNKSMCSYVVYIVDFGVFLLHIYICVYGSSLKFVCIF